MVGAGPSSSVHARRRGAVAFVVVVVLGLMSFAGTSVAGRLVTGRQVKDGSVKAVDLRPNRAVRGADVRDGTLSPTQMAPLAAGPPGATGSAGAPGLDGLASFEYLAPDFTALRNTTTPFTATCPAGKVVVGGGLSSVSQQIQIVDSHPTDDQTGWSVTVRNNAASDQTVFAWAVCVSPQ